MVTAEPITPGAQADPIPALQRRTPNPYRTPRPVAFYGVTSGRLALETTAAGGVTLPATSASTLLGWVAALPARERPRVILLCAPDAPPVAWYHEPLAQGWALTRWYNRDGMRTGVYTRDGVTLDMRLAAPWFGTTGADGAALDPFVCRDARAALRHALRYSAYNFGEHAELLNTPGMTGGELLEAALPPHLRIPTLPADLRDEIRAFSTQGRREYFPPVPGSPSMPERRIIGNAWMVDSVFQYAACLAHLPQGRIQRDHVNAFAGFVPGFYRVRATVPAGWDHLGLLFCRESDGSVSYPHTPGMTFETWVTSAELDLAVNPAHGYCWPVEILERILWPETHKLTDPLRTWITKLRGLRSQFHARDTETAQLAASAVRHLVIDTIGRWHAGVREEWGILPLDRINELPAGAIPHITQGAGGASLVSFMLPAQVDPKLQRFSHPEWSATVWGRSRARTTRYALTLPYRSLIRIHTDGIWSTSSDHLAALAAAEYAAPGGELLPGAWRVKMELRGPHPWPPSEQQFLALLDTQEWSDAPEMTGGR